MTFDHFLTIVSAVGSFVFGLSLLLMASKLNRLERRLEYLEARVSRWASVVAAMGGVPVARVEQAPSYRLPAMPRMDTPNDRSRIVDL